MNRWVEPAGSFFDPDAVDRCFVLPGPALRRVEGRSYCAALDLGHVNDRSVLAVAHLEAGAVELDGLHVWRGSSARPVNFAEVEDAVVDVHRRFGCRVLLDPWQALHLAQRLRRHGVRVEEFNFSVGSKQRLASTLLQLVNDRALRLFEAEGLREELKQLRVRQSSSGAWSFDHDAGKHDDQAVALALAWSACRWCGERSDVCNGGSVWGGDGFREPVVQRGDLRLVGSRYVDEPGHGETVTRV